MGILKDKIEYHIYVNNFTNELQCGATKGRRPAENLFILRYCIDFSFINKKPLYILSIDYAKAFDSIKRLEMMKILQEYRVDPMIVNLIKQIYTNDSTTLYLNAQKVIDIEITSGIRQGCNMSALLFILVTYKIIEDIDKFNKGYNDEEFKISSLFYMDDGIIFTHEKDQMERIINHIQQTSQKYGLELNKSKCKIMLFNCKNEDVIFDIEVVNQIKYLGVLIDNKRNCFQSQKEKSLQSSIKFSNQLYSILGNCCNSMLIGKTFWKSLALPCFLYGSDIISYNIKDLDMQQKIENKAFRTILRLPKFTAIEFLRGEIGASSSRARSIKNKLLFLKHSLSSGNELLRNIVDKELEIKKTSWSKEILTNLNEININLTQLINLSINCIKGKINEWDNNRWKAGMEYLVSYVGSQI